MAFEIPREDSKSIATIHRLSESVMDAFISAVSAAPPIANPKDMAERVAEAIPSVPIEQVQAVTGTLYTLYHIRELSGVKNSQFLDDLMAGVEKIRTSMSPKRRGCGRCSVG